MGETKPPEQTLRIVGIIPLGPTRFAGKITRRIKRLQRCATA
jgi:hypothetical protein